MNHFMTIVKVRRSAQVFAVVLGSLLAGRDRCADAPASCPNFETWSTRQLVMAGRPDCLGEFRNQLAARAFHPHESLLSSDVHSHSRPSTPLCVRQHCSYTRPNVLKSRDSRLHPIGTGIAVMACTLDEVRIGSADNLSDRCSGHVQAHV